MISILAQNNTQQAAPAFDPMTLILLLAFALLIFMMFRGRKKQRQQQEQLKSELSPGAQVMTQFGLVGTVVSIDEAENKVVLELSPGSTATVHTQAVARIMPPEETEAEAPAASPVADDEAFPAGNASPAVETPEETRRRLEGNDTKE